MINVVFAMLWARRGQAVLLALLAMLAVSAAVAAPAYLRAADRAVAAGQVAVATPAESRVEITETVPDQRRGNPPANDHAVSLSETGAALLGLPGFRYTYAEEFDVATLNRDERYHAEVVHRQDVCAHLVMVAGRCLRSESEAIISEQAARRFKISPGDPVPLTFVIFKAKWEPHYEANGRPEQVVVSGVYRVVDEREPYWGDHRYFADQGPGLEGAPIFVNAATILAVDHGVTRQSLDGVAGPGALAIDRLPALRRALAALQGSVTRIGEPVRLRTGLPDLLARVDAGTGSGRLLLPVPAIALVLLGCATVFLAVGYSTGGRRPELAVVALRGARPGTRWWLASAESLAAIAVGAVAGCLLGQLLVNTVAALRFPGVGADAGLASLRYAPLAAAAVAVTALLAQRRHVRSPVAQLLRRVPGGSSIAAVAGQFVLAVLAVVAVAQLRVTHGDLHGVGPFAPALILLALAQLASRTVLPVLARFARRALRRGRLGLALAGLQLARRPGAAPLFALLVAVAALAGYAAAAVDVGVRDRRAQAEQGTGAAQVLTVQSVDRSTLLSAVRAADPDGRFAMAVVALPHRDGEPVTLGVDSPRLARVAYLVDAGAASRLRPVAPESVTVAGPGVSLDLTTTGLAAGKSVILAAVLSSSAGLGDAVVPFGNLLAGRHTYTRKVPVCEQRCRITALRFTESGEGAADISGSVLLHLASPVRQWRSATVGPDGVRVDLAALNRQSDGLIVQPAGMPLPLPVAVAGPPPEAAVTGFDGRPVPVTTALRMPAVPGVGRSARLVDLESADLLSTSADVTTDEKVWLAADAPADAVARLEEHGLVVNADVRAAQVREQLDRQGPAVALDFYAIAGVLAIGLGAGALILAAGVDRRRRAEDLNALRAQGVSRRVARRATLATYPALVLAAVVAGTAVAVLTWWFTGWALPLSTGDPQVLALPTWPSATVLAATAAVALVVLAAVAYVTGRGTLRRIR